MTVDTVEDLYNEIEHLIDVPFEKFSKDVQQYQMADDTAAGLEEFDHHYQQPLQRQPSLHQEQTHSPPANDASFERPILIESDSDEVEEELLTPDQQLTYITCYKCNKVLPFESNNALGANNNVNVCLDCSTKKRGRSRSFISEVADKLKNLGSSSNTVSLLSPSTAKIDRRKSMPSMNDAYTSSSLAPSPTPSRPSSRASSFIEDVKQFLAPLSRKSSRNSMFQDYQQGDHASHKGPSRKTSHNSLLDAINICKPKQRQQHTSPSYERRIMDENNWTQEDNEVMNIFQQQQQQPSPSHHNMEDLDVVQHIPIRRKQIKQIESRQDRIDIYNSAYLDCMQAPTDLVPWIIKQTQKGPPDDWFGYTPPATREPKKVMGIFKRKAKSRGDLRAQQLQLGDELLNRSTPLLHHRYSNSNLSVSPSANSMYMDNADVVHSPSEITPQDYDDHGQEYFDGYHDHPTAASISPSQNALLSPMEDPLTPPTHQSQPVQPVSILKKSNSNRQLQQQPDYAYDPYYQDTVPYDDVEDDDYHNYNQGAMYNNAYDYDEYGYEQPTRHYAAAPMRAPIRQRSSSSMVADRNRYNSSRQQMMNEQDYHISMDPPRRRRSSRSRSRNEDYYYNDAPVPVYYDDPPPSSYYDAPPAPAPSRRARDHYQPPSHGAMRSSSNSSSRQSSMAAHSSNNNNNKKPHDYYGLSAKLTPFMMEEWEITLDELCDLFPRLDRHYINDFLRSAQGDFVTAKNMIMEMIMEIR
ncbi:hypothetical protein V8B55DRAFT_1041319 [Mucor lusitanicus]